MDVDFDGELSELSSSDEEEEEEEEIEIEHPPNHVRADLPPSPKQDVLTLYHNHTTNSRTLLKDLVHPLGFGAALRGML